MPSTSFRRLRSAMALVTATLIGVSVQAATFSGMFVFGDSLSDSGNNTLAGLYDPAQVITGNSYVPANTYGPNGTYSNGPVWATYFAQMFGLPLVPSLTMPGGGNNFASGGATTGTPGEGAGGYPYSLRVQAGQFLGATGGVAPADALYVVAGGGNNARAALDAMFVPGADPFAIIGAAAASFADDIGDIVDDLQAAGAQHIVVWNTPNIGLVPAIVAAGGQGAASLLVNAMNGQLALRLAGESGVRTFDTYSFGSMIVANPAAFGLTNVSDACGAVVGANCSQYAYWDGIHPTTAVHRLVANAMALAVPEPQTYALLALGLVAVGWQARRGRSRAGTAAA